MKKLDIIYYGWMAIILIAWLVLCNVSSRFNISSFHFWTVIFIPFVILYIISCFIILILFGNSEVEK